MPRGRPLAVLTLTDDDRETLTRWTRRPKTAQALAQRARIVLAAADGRPNDAIAGELSVSAHTVGKWRRRFRERGPDGLLDEPRPGAPRTIGDDRIEAVFPAPVYRQRCHCTVYVDATGHHAISYLTPLWPRFGRGAGSGQLGGGDGSTIQHYSSRLLGGGPSDRATRWPTVTRRSPGYFPGRLRGARARLSCRTRGAGRGGVSTNADRACTYCPAELPVHGH
jgi:hypothetical protein